MTLRTSQTHPIQIAEIRAAPDQGLVGMTFCPGKVQKSAQSGDWSRSLDLDLDAIAAWGAVAVVTLVQDHELKALQVEGMGEAVRDRHMVWFHLPIADGYPPDETWEAEWLIAGRALRRMIRAGFNVLIHCKGGLGRAGTIAARLMVELGMDADAAIHAVRAARSPDAIETEDQASHVRAQSRARDGKAATTDEARRDRAVGALLGLAVGDAVGTTLEFKRRGSYPRLKDMAGGGEFKLQPGQWTDDTAMAIALAVSLNETGDLDERDLMGRFLTWRRNGDYSCTGTCFDIGTTTSEALRRFELDGEPIAGSTDDGAAGNGSLMRLAPIPIRYWQDRLSLRDTAARQSRTTHAAAACVDACVTFAEMIADAIEGQPFDAVLARKPLLSSPEIIQIAEGSWRGRHRSTIQSSGYVVHSLEAALWCVATTHDFESAVLKAANLGGDADTTAAITGQLAGALYGASGIPQHWRGRVAWPDRIRNLASTLLDQADGVPSSERLKGRG